MAIDEEYWPDMEGLDHRDTTTDFGLPEGTFFDVASYICSPLPRSISCGCCSAGAVRVRRFRPNLSSRRRKARRISSRMLGSGKC